MIDAIISKSLDQLTPLEWASIQSFVTTDQLSGVGNYAFFDMELGRAWAKHQRYQGQERRRYQESLSLIFLDLDNFGLINKEHGHAWGDECISLVGQVLKQSTRRRNKIARPIRKGGDEFVIILDRTDLDGAIKFGERIRLLINSMRFPFGHITTSIGVASVVPQGNDAQQLVDASDAALRRAKRGGRNQVSI